MTTSAKERQRSVALSPPKPVDLAFPEKLRPLFEPHRYKVAYGGRGGAKSWGFARALIIRCAERPTRALCAREIQGSIRESVHKLLADQIRDMRLGHAFRVTDTEISCKYTGSTIVFSGLRNNITKVKSMEGIDVCWVEEAEKVSEESWQVLIPTIRKEVKDEHGRVISFSEIWATLNPDLVTDPTAQRFIVNTPPDCALMRINWQDNPWFPEILRREMEYAYRVDPEAAAWVWGGEFRTNSNACILRNKYRIEAFSDSLYREADRLLFGADFGFAVDPSTLIRCFILGTKLYIDSEAYGVGVELLDMPRFYARVPQARRWPIKADAARPETISHLRGAGFQISAATKWQGSVEDGIAYLRGFEEIIIHPRCKHTAEEARLYSYKVDKVTREVLPVVQDKHNHCWDAVRYALDGYITRRGDVGIYHQIGEQALEHQAAAAGTVESALDEGEEIV